MELFINDNDCRGALRAPANHPYRVTTKRAHAMRPYKHYRRLKVLSTMKYGTSSF
jgi:hypothetical protein